MRNSLQKKFIIKLRRKVIMKGLTWPTITIKPVERFSGTGNVHSAESSSPTGYAARPKTPNRKEAI